MDAATITAIIVAVLGAGGVGAMWRELLAHMNKKYAETQRAKKAVLDAGTKRHEAEHDHDRASENTLVALLREATDNFTKERQIDRDASEEGRRLDREACNREHKAVIRQIVRMGDAINDRIREHNEAVGKLMRELNESNQKMLREVHDANIKAHTDNRHDVMLALTSAVAPIIKYTTEQQARAEGHRT